LPGDVEDIREMGKPPETPNPKPEREMEKERRNPETREENGKKKRKREGEPNGVTTPLPSSKNRDVLYAMG